jgi:hypothetical protein
VQKRAVLGTIHALAVLVSAACAHGLALYSSSISRVTQCQELIRGVQEKENAAKEKQLSTAAEQKEGAGKKGDIRY